MGYANPPRTADDILDTLRDILVAADVLTETLNLSLQCADGHGIPFFGLRSISAAGRRGLSQVELSREARISPPSTTRMVDASERSGVLSRIPHPTDRRLNMVVLTALGQAMIDQIAFDLTGPGSRLGHPDGSQHDHLKAQLRALQQSHYALFGALTPTTAESTDPYDRGEQRAYPLA